MRGAKGSSGRSDVVRRAMSISSDPKAPRSPLPNLMSVSSCPVAAASPNGDSFPSRLLAGGGSCSLTGDEDVCAGVGDGVEVMVGTKAATSSLSGGVEDCIGDAPRGDGIEISATGGLVDSWMS